MTNQQIVKKINRRLFRERVRKHIPQPELVVSGYGNRVYWVCGNSL
jgi:hypothetical protein